MPQLAHPRSRGEHAIATAVGVIMAGSSPLTRGARPHGETPVRNDRLIPAHAGSTASMPLFLRICQAHPRSRGEHAIDYAAKYFRVGSSPLTRGAPSGFVAAGAEEEAHPRSRGEHAPTGARFDRDRGSSPLTRGAPFHARNSCPTLRLIPAHAGSTSWIAWTAPAKTAHPRSRGEHDLSFPEAHRLGGSSPLTRGALRR
ncbi:hypothetical protein HMPREF9004_1135 [Schaalia cardiffensis F0333]|uniref:Uncharacterized protein n=1 Tax=Schaalia cardiffensis F0333 TaxID=888050 RepID=N6WD18_9ACTO|nr:hypothetical protein HMPREF9004_1135 [Schaalia cardiffensis F0333]